MLTHCLHHLHWGSLASEFQPTVWGIPGSDLLRGVMWGITQEHNEKACCQEKKKAKRTFCLYFNSIFKQFHPKIYLKHKLKHRKSFWELEKLNNFYSNFMPLRFKVSTHDVILLERVKRRGRSLQMEVFTISLRGRKLYLAGERNKGTSDY